VVTNPISHGILLVFESSLSPRRAAKPPLVAWGAQGLRELRDVLSEEISRR